MFEHFIQRAILFLPPFLLAISLHESAHAYVAYRFGDSTAKDLGRITLNPIPHIDPIGLLMILTIGFGAAKPVPVNPYNLKNPIKDNLWIALAGPASNLVLAIVSAMVFRVVAPHLEATQAGIFIANMILTSVTLNIVLMVFNLFPIPPLDGFHILQGMVSTENYIRLERLRVYTPYVMIALMISFFMGFNIFAPIFGPIVSVLGGFLLGMPVGW
jgi:Zn-dependent protease